VGTYSSHRPITPVPDICRAPRDRSSLTGKDSSILADYWGVKCPERRFGQVRRARPPSRPFSKWPTIRPEHDGASRNLGAHGQEPLPSTKQISVGPELHGRPFARTDRRSAATFPKRTSGQRTRLDGLQLPVNRRFGTNPRFDRLNLGLSPAFCPLSARATSSVATRSSPLSARAGWTKCERRPIRAWTASSPSSGSTACFEQEARAIAALNYPSICTLYEVALTTVMDYIEGTPLNVLCRLIRR
jgi:hypothetical protein